MLKYLTFVVLLLLANGLFFFFGGAAWLATMVPATTSEPTPKVFRAEMVDVFAYTLEDEVQKKIGQPIEGYAPAMFLTVFPGLTETDFDGVEASSGVYQLEQGKLIFVPDNTKLMHSAAGAITRAGMATLLANVSARARIDLTGSGTLTELMRLIAQ